MRQNSSFVTERGKIVVLQRKWLKTKTSIQPKTEKKRGKQGIFCFSLLFEKESRLFLKRRNSEFVIDIQALTRTVSSNQSPSPYRIGRYKKKSKLTWDTSTTAAIKKTKMMLRLQNSLLSGSHLTRVGRTIGARSLVTKPTEWSSASIRTVSLCSLFIS